jgi:hypothetical protein
MSINIEVKASLMEAYALDTVRWIHNWCCGRVEATISAWLTTSESFGRAMQVVAEHLDGHDCGETCRTRSIFNGCASLVRR